MSTYLLCIVVGKFEKLTLYSKREIEMSFYMQEGHLEEVKEMAEVAQKAFDILEDYFAIEYPLSKIDFISYNHFPLVAMENWGCLVFH